MSNIIQDLITYISASTSISASVHYQQVPQATTGGRVWLRQASDATINTLDRTGGLHEAFFDLEAIGATEEAAQDLADQLHDRLNNYQGTVGNSEAQGIWLSDKDDTYEPQGIESDVGEHVVAYDTRVFYST